MHDDVFAKLAAVHADVGSAIVNVVERCSPGRLHPIGAAEISRYGKHAVIIVVPSRALKRLRGVELVPIGDGRALIALEPSTSVSALELQVRDALEHLPRAERDRNSLESLAEILRRTRGPGRFTSTARTIIVLASKTRKRAS